MTHVSIYRIDGLVDIDDDVRSVRTRGKRVRIVALDGSVTYVPWSVVTRLVVSHPAGPYEDR